MVELEALSTPTNAAALVLTLDTSTLKDIVGSGFGGAGDAKTLAYFSGTWTNDESGNLGVANNGSSGNKTSSFYTYWNLPTRGTGNATGTGLATIFNSSTDWSSIKAVSLVYAFDSVSTTGTVNTVLAVSILNTDGTVSTTSAEKSNVIHWSGEGDSYGFLAKNFTYDSTYVSSCEVKQGVQTTSSAEAFAIAAIPEPSAFGLLAGVGALALVASRRRRK